MGIILVRALRKFLDQEKKILGFLDDMYEGSDNAFMQRRCCQKILLRLHHRVPILVRRKHTHIFLENDGLQRVLDILTTHSHELALRAVFELICELAYDHTSAERIHELNIVQLMEKVVAENNDDQYLVSDLKLTKTRLPATFLRIARSRIESAVQDRDVSKIIMLMFLHPTNLEVQDTAVDALLKITKNNSEHFCKTVVELDREGHGVSITMIQSMEAHKDNIELIEKFVSLINVMTRNVHMCSILGKHDMVSALLDLFQRHPSERFMLQYAVFSLNEMLKVEKNVIRFKTLEGPKRLSRIVKALEENAREFGVFDRVSGKVLADWKEQRKREASAVVVKDGIDVSHQASGGDETWDTTVDINGSDESSASRVLKGAAVYSIDPAEEVVNETAVLEEKYENKFSRQSVKQMQDKEMLTVPSLCLPLATRRLLTAYLKTDQARKDAVQDEENDTENAKKKGRIGNSVAADMETTAMPKSGKRFSNVKVAAEVP